MFSSLSGILGNCPLVQPPQWGIVRERILQDGTLQTIYSCEPGRRLKGHKIATCTADGWDHPIPRCVPRGEISPPILSEPCLRLVMRLPAVSGAHVRTLRLNPARDSPLGLVPVSSRVVPLLSRAIRSPRRSAWIHIDLHDRNGDVCLGSIDIPPFAERVRHLPMRHKPADLSRSRRLFMRRDRIGMLKFLRNNLLKDTHSIIRYTSRTIFLFLIRII